MKKNLLSLSVLLTGIALASCQKENVIQPQENGPEKKHFEVTFNEEENARMVLLRGDYAVSKTDLLNQAQGFIKGLTAEETKTKGHAISRMPVLVDSLVDAFPAGVATKGAGLMPQEAKVYVVSFGNDAGYAFFAGDKRAGGLLGFVGEGNFDADTDNPGLRFTYGCMTQYVASEIERMEGLRGDSLYTAMAEQYAPLVSDKPQTKVYMPVFNGIEWIWTEVDNAEQRPEEYVYSWEIHQPELLKTYWGQGFPFNRIINQVYNNNYKTGCVTTAVAQIMNYHQYPHVIEGTTMNWNSYWNYNDEWSLANTINPNDPSLDNMGQLFYILTKSNHLNISLGQSSSSGKDKDVPPTLRGFGYNTSWVLDYNLSTVVSNIHKNRPVYLAANDPTSGGHAWVADGSAYACDTVIRKTVYYYQGNEVGYSLEKGAVNGRSYIHCNWGWYDRPTAAPSDRSYQWFSGNIFNPVNKEEGGRYNLSHDQKMIVDIYPN